jgi:hypothetical protein
VKPKGWLGKNAALPLTLKVVAIAVLVRASQEIYRPESALILSNLAHKRHYLVSYGFQIRNRRSADPGRKDIRAIAGSA